MKLYVVGVWPEDKDDWELCGVYDDSFVAIKKCITPNHFVGPVKLNEDYNEAETDWPEAYYPMREINPMVQI